ncbi:hypothetical protein [Spirosoma sp.]|nr:hypothetical protein [Spirosoma sp.]MCX6215802.1 hypothetical protein [Spirosoma sp.]
MLRTAFNYFLERANNGILFRQQTTSSESDTESKPMYVGGFQVRSYGSFH